MKKNKIILFDIDKTLLNTDLFMERLTEMIVKHSKAKIEEINRSIDEYIESLELIYYFDFLTLLDRLDFSKKQYNLIKKEYEENNYIFPKYKDVIPVLKYLKKNNYDIGIFSEGVPRFQKNKLKNLKIDEYINPKYIFITQLKRFDNFIERIPEGCYIVDDNIEVIRFLEEKKMYYPIFLKRKRDEKGRGKFKTIYSLDEIKNILL